MKRKYLRIDCSLAHLPGLLILMLSLLMCASEAHAALDSGASAEVENYSVQVELYSHIYPPRVFKGILSKDRNDQCRLTMYWKKPSDVYFDCSDHFSYADLLFTPSRLYGYWGLARPGDERFETDPKNSEPPKLLHSKDDKAFLTKVVAYAAHLAQSGSLDFEDWVAELAYPHISEATKATQPGSTEVASQSIALSDKHTTKSSIPPSLPFGRETILRQEPNEGKLLQIVRRNDKKPVLKVRLKPITLRHDLQKTLFDSKTVGNPGHIAQAYCEYWRLLQQWWHRMSITNGKSREFLLGIYNGATALADRGVPDEILLPLHAVAARAAGACGQIDYAMESVDAFLDNMHNKTEQIRNALEVISDVQSLLTEAKTTQAAQINDLCTLRVRRLVRISHASASQLLENIEQLLTKRKYDTCRIVLAELRSSGFHDSKKLEYYERRIKSREIKHEQIIPNYVKHIRQLRKGGLTTGTLTQERMRSCIIAGLVESGWDKTAAQQFAVQTCDKIALLVGLGPYPSDAGSLQKAISQVPKAGWPPTNENALSWLSSLIAVSFFDTSTESHHDELLHQLLSCVEHAVDAMWDELGSQEMYGSAITKQEVSKQVHQVFRDARRYVDNPLWPMFKYPLSNNEFTRLRNRLALQAESEIQTLKGFYNEEKDDGERRQRMLNRVSWLTRNLMSNVVSLRMPRLVGLGLEMRSRTPLRITWKPSIPDNRVEAREVLSKLLYFFVGHRLDD